MPRKTDANNPADWLWMGETDLDDPDWPALRALIEEVGQLLTRIRGNLAART